MKKQKVKFMKLGAVTLGIEKRRAGFRVALVRARAKICSVRAARTAAAKALRNNESCVICDAVGLEQLISRLQVKELCGNRVI